ncbi:ParB/Srx family N-terminal domain-containing protein [Paraburkholderia mimosarum]|uniref:ParB/Srx family N-terminal domain-containing protein n=1 Tax=Paraburkholderia mimosarum TaxID=312026 RepID=UPI000423B75B|nr:ParB/Srx family N-terminal domain-containing protein [Paraburkholderia mimosarum]
MSSAPQRAEADASARLADAIEWWPIERVRESPRNARTHSPEQVEQIAQSMSEFGWTFPALVDETGELICGHGRYRAAVLLGYTEAKVIVARGWSDAKVRAYRIADNKIALNAGWDEELLAAELAGLLDIGYDLGLTGFGSDDLAALANAPVTHEAPEEFARKDETIETEHRCPKCGYEWSGKAQ